MHLGPMNTDWMQWIPCGVMELIPIECSGFPAAWRNWSRLNAVDSMQCGPMDLDWMQWIPCSVAQWILLNAVDSRHHGAMDPDWMQWIPCSEAQGIPIECSEFNAACPKSPRLNAVDSMPRDCLQLIPCSMAQCSRLNAVVEMKHDWMPWIPCSMVQWMPMECSGFHAAWRKGSWWNAVDYLQHDWMQ